MVVVEKDVECKIIQSEVKKPDLITLDDGGDSTKPNSTSSEMQKQKIFTQSKAQTILSTPIIPEEKIW